jgi:hypothetical protein
MHAAHPQGAHNPDSRLTREILDRIGTSGRST